MSLLSPTASNLLKAYSRIAPTERGGYRLARLARSFIPRNQWQSERLTPDRLRMNLDLSTYPDICMAFGLYELDTLRLLRRLLRPGDHFVDCGANIGYFTLLAAQLVGPTGKIDAFEPDPINRRQLQLHLEMNSLANQVHIHDQALGSAPARVDLYHPTSPASNHGMASIYPSLAGADQKFTVDVVRLDDALDGIPQLIKLDVEGAELAAIQGMSRFLSSAHPPRLIIEHNPVSCAAAGYKPSDLLNAILTFQPRYRAFYIAWRLRPVDAQSLDRIARQGNLLVTSD